MKKQTKGQTNQAAIVARIVGDKDATISSKMVALNRLQIPATEICRLLGTNGTPKRLQHFRNVVKPYCESIGVPYVTYNSRTKKASIGAQLDKWFGVTKRAAKVAVFGTTKKARKLS